MKELTPKQIARQDFVDNAIFSMVEIIIGKKIVWNIEMISSLREEIAEWVVDKYGLMTEEEFYPFGKE